MNRPLALAGLLLLLLPLALLAPEAHAEADTPTLKVNYLVQLGQHYSLYGSVDHDVFFTVTGTPGTGRNTGTELYVYFTFTYIDVIGLPKTATYTVSGIGPFGVTLLHVHLAPSTASFNFTLRGQIYDSSLFYRNVADIPFVQVFMNAPPFNPTSYIVIVPQPFSTQIYDVYPPSNQNAVSQQEVIGGTQYYSLHFPPTLENVVVYYQQPYRDAYFFGYLIAVGAFFLMIPILMRTTRRIATNHLHALTSRLHRPRLSMNSKRWLTLFVLTSLFMISVAFLFGPSPTPRVFLAATPDTAKQLAPLFKQAGVSYFTPAQVTGTDKFDTMSTLGSFDAIVLSDYPPPLYTSGLTSAFHIIALANYLPPSTLSTLEALYPNYQLTVINDPSALTAALSQIPPRSNPLGIHVSQGLYNRIVQLEGLLSFVVPFLALAFFSSAVIEGGGRGLGGIGEAVAFSVLAFFFSQIIYIVSTLFLGLPVGLHASTSPEVTAVGYLGFGGGSRPRMVAGSLGFLCGMFTSRIGRSKLDLAGLAVFTFVTIFFIIDPLRLGGLLGQYGLYSFTGETNGVGGVSGGGVRSMIGTSMTLFGDYTTAGYYAQHGASLFYVGAVPFAVYSKLGKTTSTFLGLFAAFAAGSGFIRIADMIPLKSVASVIPGVAVGFGFIALFLGLNWVESAMRRRFVRA